MSDIDVAIFEFISKLGIIELAPSKDHAELKGNDPLIDLGEVKNFGISQVDPNDGSIISKYVDVGGKLTGLDEKSFTELKELVAELLIKEPFASLADAEFLVNESFTWIINVHKNQKADSNLTAHLLTILNSQANNHRFYFRIEPLEIENAFPIGNVEFKYFSYDDIQTLYELYIIAHPDTTLERFNEICAKNFNRVNACIEVKGVFSRAEEEAIRKVELAVDVLKICCIGEAMQFKVQVFDLDRKLQRKMPSYFLTHAGNDVSNLSAQIRNHGEVAPIRLTNQKLKELDSRGLLKFAAFIQYPKDNQLYDEIIGLIHQLGTIISTPDNYEKVVKAISLLESILVPKDAGGKAMGLTKLKLVIPKLVASMNEQELLLKIAPVFYNIRDRYLHNYRKLLINIEHLMFLLNFERVLILKLIKLNVTLSSIEEVHNYFGLKS